MLTALRELVREPRPELTEEPLLDRRIIGILAAVAVVLGLLEWQFEQQVTTIAIGLAMAYALRWCRVHPLWLTIGFGVIVALIEVWQFRQAVVIGTSILIFAWIAVFALARYGSGRELLIGGATVVARPLIFFSTLGIDRNQMISLTLAELFPLAFGLASRLQADIRKERLEAVRLSERHSIARELHDSVAHHVSAITIQAQAASVLAERRPEVVGQVLSTIEEEAARTLDEMRRMVTKLRDSDTDVDLRPQAGLDDLAELATTTTSPRVNVTLRGELDHVDSSTEAALFRLAQESVTNARRHARNATRVDIEVTGHTDRIELRVTDDGDPVASFDEGFGLTGLRERAERLDGSFSAGPDPVRGWAVHVSLPMSTHS